MAFAGGAATGEFVAANKKRGKLCQKCRWTLLVSSIVVYVSIFSIVNLAYLNR
jgi:hypothetical protein